MITCFAIKDKEELKKYENYELIHPDPENYNRCIYRERWQEINAAKFPIFWNSEKRIFTDINFKVIPFNYYYDPPVVFIRASIPFYKNIIEDMYKLYPYWTPIESKYDYLSIVHWMISLPSYFLKRKIIVTSKGLASQYFNRYYDLIKDNKDRFFIKSVDKGWSYDGSKEGFYETGMIYSLEKGSENDLVMFSEFMEIEEDDLQTMEYRCFFINGQLKSVSRYLDYEEHTIPKEVYDYIYFIAPKILGKFVPKNVVMDIVKLKDGCYTMVEFNSVCCSGRYINNKPEYLFND